MLRDRYFDVLRAVALMRVVVYHSLGLAWLTVAFPAIGVMFALAGSLMAASLDRSGPSALRSRLRRLLPPVWCLAAVAVPAMLLAGVTPGWSMLWWLFPVSDPQISGWMAPALGMIWYIRAYLWFVLLSPLLLKAFRRWPLVSLAVPLATLVGFIALGARGIAVPGPIWDFALYGTCWQLGFAHHDRLLHRVRFKTLVLTAGTLASAGLAWIFTHPSSRGYDLNDIPLGNALWSIAVTIVLLRFRPKRGFLDRVPWIARLVSVINGRAMTIYLWHQAAILAALRLRGDWAPRVEGVLGAAVMVTIVGALVFTAMLLFGWVEDLAARRRPAALPRQRTRSPERTAVAANR